MDHRNLLSKSEHVCGQGRFARFAWRLAGALSIVAALTLAAHHPHFSAQHKNDTCVLCIASRSVTPAPEAGVAITLLPPLASPAPRAIADRFFPQEIFFAPTALRGPPSLSV